MSLEKTIPAIRDRNLLLGSEITAAEYAAAKAAIPHGSGTGSAAIITATDRVVFSTSAGAANWLTLPTPVAGIAIRIFVIGGTNHELRTTDPSTIGINSITGGSVELLCTNGDIIDLLCVSTTNWVAITHAATSLTAD